MMELYYSPNSPYARKVRIVLREKGLACRETAIDTANLPPEFTRHNPNLRVPVLMDGGRTLFESNIIVDCLLQKAAPPPDGSPPLAKAMTRPGEHWNDLLVLNTIETLLDSGLNIFQLKRSGVSTDQAAYLRAEARRMQSDLNWLEERATTEGFVPGTFSIQDLNLVCALDWVNFRKPAELRLGPKLSVILQRYRERPSVAATVPG